MATTRRGVLGQFVQKHVTMEFRIVLVTARILPHRTEVMIVRDWENPLKHRSVASNGAEVRVKSIESHQA